MAGLAMRGRGRLQVSSPFIANPKPELCLQALRAGATSTNMPQEKAHGPSPDASTAKQPHLGAGAQITPNPQE